MNDTLSKIKQMESALKELLIQTYGRFLPIDRVNMLKATNYTANDLLNCKTSSELRGKLLRRMLADLIKMQTSKEMALPDGNVITINYGESLEKSLINYYAHEMAERYHFDITELDDVKDDLESIKAIYDKIGNKVDYSAFNEDAIKLLKKADLKEITKKYDDKELQRYFTNVAQIAAMGQEEKQKQNDMLNEATTRIDSVQIVWLHDQKHIKYTDPYGTVHLTNIDKAPRVEEYYKQKLASLGPDEKIDPEEFYHDLITYYTNEMEMLSTKNVDKSDLNSKQVDMLKFMETTPVLEHAREIDIMKHNSGMDIHVMQGTKDIVTTKDKDDHVEAAIVKDGQAQATSFTSGEKGKDISQELISKEEYIRLNNKLFSQEELTPEEVEALRRAAPVYAEEVFNETRDQRITSEGGAVLKPYSNPYSTKDAAAGFTLKTFALYFVVLTLLIGSFIAILLLK